MRNTNIVDCTQCHTTMYNTTALWICMNIKTNELVRLCPKCMAKIYNKAIDQIEISKDREDILQMDTTEAKKQLKEWVKQQE